MPVHESPRNVHGHETPPHQYIQLPIIPRRRSLPHPAYRKTRHITHGVVPVLQEERPAERPRKELTTRSVLFRIRHRERCVSARLRSELAVPRRFAETATDAMDGGEAFRVADGDFTGGDAHDAAVLGVQIVDVECSTTAYDGELERKPGEARVPWSWERAKWVPEALVENLSIDQE